MAIACMKTAHALNREVPQALSVIGFDDIPEAVQLGLTTIGQPIVEKGVYAARLLTEQLNAPADAPLQPEQKIFATKLIVRTSTRKVQDA
jgi:DNA-binding LacI/PurR family transcriptional regulator